MARAMQRFLTIPKDEIESCLKALVAAKELGMISLRGYKIIVDTDRYENLYYHGLKCAQCGLEAKFAAIEKNIYSKDKFHLNVYGIDKNGKELMLTKDHIFPRILGGLDTLNNYQVLCERCNSCKGNKTDLTADEAIARGLTTPEVAATLSSILANRDLINVYQNQILELKKQNAKMYGSIANIFSQKRDVKEFK